MLSPIRKFVKLAAFAIVLLPAACGQPEAPAITVDSAWARATAPGQASTAIYFTLRNEGGADRLMSVTTPAGSASLHSTTIGGGIMRMRPLDGLDVPAHSTVTLQPGGTHVMVTGVKQALAQGAVLPVQLNFGKSGEVKASAAVRGLGQGMAM